MTTAIIVENNTPSFINVSVDSGDLVSVSTETYLVSMMETDKISVLFEVQQGLPGPTGNVNDLEMPDLALIFEGALI